MTAGVVTIDLAAMLFTRRSGDLCSGSGEPEILRCEFEEVIPRQATGMGDLKPSGLYTCLKKER